ncbi:hypothetical protein FV139_13595 [Parahaliea maris]|uniref:Peptidoglycan-binding protein CsiV n=1 Tax=Parahaliea maris TaxID=2716870 RepID=A0A5C8ZWP1_9GAMM|nr:CsiV family protein [Parahaliea maris]TXS92983.1 hypothetical protein FV139_13595 [Parahaliea maris]
MNRRLTALASLLGLLATQSAWSQLELVPEEDSGQRWYRVELMIFTQGNAGAASAERWDPLPELAYPERHRFLVYPEKVEARIAAHPAGENQAVTSTIGPEGKQTIEFVNIEIEEEPELTEGPLDIPYREAAPTTEPLPDAQPGGDQALLPGEAVPTDGELLPEEEPAPPPRPTPWVVRPAAEQEFRGKAAYMERRGGYQMLFHQAWLQPMAGENEARAIIIDDSGSEASYPRLQGSVRIYVSRFLHIDTHLWLNTEGEYLPGDWRMPAPPLAPASLSIVEPLDPNEFGEYVVRADAVLDGTAWTDGEAVSPGEIAVNPTPGALPPPYPYRHAIVLQQHRRMRSTEVHYLDHPMLGVVVKLTPLSEETLEQLGEAEAEARAALEQEAGVLEGALPGVL